MKPITFVGIVLIVLGLVALGYQGVITYTTREQVVKVGPVEVTARSTGGFQRQNAAMPQRVFPPTRRKRPPAYRIRAERAAEKISALG